MNPVSVKSIAEKGMVFQVVNDLTKSFSGSNHVAWIMFLPVVL